MQEVEDILVQAFGRDTAQMYLEMIENEQLFVEKTAYEILWGYDEPIYEILTLLGLTNSSQFALRVRKLKLSCAIVYL